MKNFFKEQIRKAKQYRIEKYRKNHEYEGHQIVFELFADNFDPEIMFKELIDTIEENCFYYKIIFQYKKHDLKSVTDTRTDEIIQITVIKNTVIANMSFIFNEDWMEEKGLDKKTKKIIEENNPITNLNKFLERSFYKKLDIVLNRLKENNIIYHYKEFSFQKKGISSTNNQIVYSNREDVTKPLNVKKEINNFLWLKYGENETYSENKIKKIIEKITEKKILILWKDNKEKIYQIIHNKLIPIRQ